MLKLFLDSADLKVAETWLTSGLFYGVTSNPLILERAGLKNNLATLTHLMQTWDQLESQEIQVQAWGADPDQMLACAHDLLEQAAPLKARVVIKIPVTANGLIVAQRLKQQRQWVTLTASYATHQAILAHLTQADYLAPYLGRMLDQGLPAHDQLITMHQLLQTHQSSTQILVASLRQIEDIVKLATAGISCFTLRAELAEQLLEVPLTDAASINFEAIATRDAGAI